MADKLVGKSCEKLKTLFKFKVLCVKNIGIPAIRTPKSYAVLF